MIVRHRLCFVVANAAIDQSNLAEHPRERALLLPADPDASATALRNALQRRLGVSVAVLIADSFARASRMGVLGTCIGCAGLPALVDIRGRSDRRGRPPPGPKPAAAVHTAATAANDNRAADQNTPTTTR